MAPLKKVFLLPQFGSPHPWTQKFIDHVQFLGEHGWYFKIFTTNQFESKGNVEVIPMDVEQFNSLVEKKLGYNPKMFVTKSGVPSIHITDFCILYGVLFEDYLQDFDFWGMCGWDTVMGRLDHFLPDSKLDILDVWTDDIETINGTFCLFRNKFEINNLFKKSENWGAILTQGSCLRCVEGIGPHSLLGSDEYAMTDLVRSMPDIRFGYPKYYPMHGHDRLEQHIPLPKLSVKEDHSLWDLTADTNPPDWIHARPFIGHEILYFHFMVTKKWPLDDDFLEYQSWFDITYGQKLRGRYVTMKMALNLLFQQPDHRIVETGCARLPEDWGGGNSTYLFGEFVHKYGGHFTTIDIEPGNMAVAEKATKEFSGSISYIVDDSLNALPQLVEPIDLLYLDSMDVPETGDASAGQQHNLAEFKLVEHLLHTGSLILIDDNDMANGGKSRLTKVYLADKGYKVILNSNQSLWIKM